LDAPASGSIISSLGLVLSVNNAADEDEDALLYTFEVGAWPSLAPRVLLVEGVEEGRSRTALALREAALEAPLEEDGRYGWRARACDARACGPWTEVSVFLLSDQNDAPTAPEPLSPVGEVGEGAVVLEARGSVDPEGEALLYDFQVFVAGESQALYEASEGEEADEDGVRWAMSRPLEDGEAYAWRVRARDPGGRVSPWSAPLRFGRGLEVAPPEAPALVSPLEGARLAAPSEFVFVARAPEGAAAEVRYALTLWRLEGEEALEVISAEAVAGEDGLVRWSLEEAGEGAAEDSRWRWSVRGVSEAGEGAAVSAGFLYSQREGAPGVVTRQAPAAGVTLRGVEVAFAWLAASDPEGDSILYDVEVYGDEGLTALSGRGERLVGLGWSATLGDNARYWWRVRARDVGGAEGPWGEASAFVVDVRDEAPGAPEGVSPAQGQGVPASAPLALRWRRSVDPEGDAVSYEVEVYSASGVRVWEARAEGVDPDQEEVEVVHPGLARGNYSWRVRASDGRGVSAWSASLAFAAQGADPEPEPEPDMGPDEAPDMGGDAGEEPPATPMATGSGGGGCAQAPGRRGGAWAMWALALLFVWRARRV
jgi:hypothetical protein